ncbi:MAG: hypothetical protein E5299_00383 [Burkholderia gladioli]|nr:MAG: hypothetical protein E5299_00383 [Burkholderia gladioli]
MSARTQWNRLRTSEVRHAVDYADANGDLGRLRVDVTRPETVSGEHLIDPQFAILKLENRPSCGGMEKRDMRDET